MPKLEAKLTDEERMIIVHALTSAGVQYQKDASAALELAAHGTAAKAAAEALGAQFRQQAISAHQLRDKITFCGATSNYDGTAIGRPAGRWCALSPKRTIRSDRRY